MREQILNEIRKFALANDGRVPGVRIFERTTGIRESAWRGVLWARWGDAVKEAGLEPNVKQVRIEEDFFLTKLAEACRHFGRFPTAMELRMFQKQADNFPSVKSITRHFGSLKNIPSQLATWAQARNYPHIAEILAFRSAEEVAPAAATREGLVYLIRSGTHYKIGRSDELERRVKEIRTALPEAAELVHSIRTDDPSGIEAYWHKRFASQRANGEWFKLASSDVAAFKRRKYQ
jgi:Meiotically up-regulated gene 113